MHCCGAMLFVLVGLVIGQVLTIAIYQTFIFFDLLSVLMIGLMGYIIVQEVRKITMGDQGYSYD